MQDPRILRIQQLLEQSRYLEAEQILRNLLSAKAEDQNLLSMLALALAGQEKYREAEDLIQRCIGLEPDYSWYLFMYGDILLLQHKMIEAEEVARRAITMSPDVASYRALLANVLFSQKHYEDALEQADEGLALEPDNLNCLNLRASILITMGRKTEGFATSEQALEQDPENSHSHANYAWNQLQRGDHHKALEHFREALRHDPENDYAKTGLVEALQARYWVYRLFLKYYFWMSRLSGGLQWGLIIGFYIGQWILSSLAIKYPAIEPFVGPVIILYLIFVLSTWIMQPLFNLFLRLNVYGRFALSKLQIKASNYLGIALLGGIGSGIAYFLTLNTVVGFAALACLLSMIPLGSMYRPSQAKNRKILAGATLVIVLAGLGGIVHGLITGIGLNNTAIVFFVGIFSYQWLANWAMSKD